MSIKLQLSDAKIDVKPAEHLKLQFMPVGLAENSPANIDTYFNNYTENTDGSMYYIVLSLNCRTLHYNINE